MALQKDIITQEATIFSENIIEFWNQQKNDLWN